MNGYYNNVTQDRRNVTGFDVGISAVFAILGSENKKEVRQWLFWK